MKNGEAMNNIRTPKQRRRWFAVGSIQQGFLLEKNNETKGSEHRKYDCDKAKGTQMTHKDFAEWAMR